MSDMGIDVRLETEVTAFEPGRVVVADGDAVPADLVILGLGVTPNSELAGAAGAATGARGALVVDRRQRTTLDGVYAAGDCCESRHLVSGRPTHVALGTVANKQGRVAGINLGGGYATFPGVVGTAITKVCTLEIGRTGLTEREAAKEGFEAEAASIDATTHRRLPARRQTDDDQAGGGEGQWTPAGRADHRGGPCRPSGSTRWPPPSTPACASTS